jgi:heptosyltransferase-3
MISVGTLKRFIPFRPSLYRLRHRLRRRFALRPSAREARVIINTVRRLKAQHPGRPVYGILLAEHLGDIIACEPVIAWARQHQADALVVWVTGTTYASLLQEHPGLDLLLAVDSLAAIAPIVQSGVFDVAIDLHVNRKPTGVAGVIHLKSWGDPDIDFDTYLREGSLLRALSKAAGIEPFGRQPELYVSSATRSAVDALDLPSRYVVVHATSNDPARDWSIDNWLRLTEYVVRECGLPVVEVGLQPTLAVRDSSITSMSGRLSIMETAEVIRRASFFFGVDSGPAHMANACRRPSLILLGRFRGYEWCPYEGFFVEGKRERLFRHNGPLSEVTAARVIQRLNADELWLRLVGENHDRQKNSEAY